MSKYVFSFNRQSSCKWDADPRYNELLINSVIEYLKALKKVDGVIFMKEALKSFGFNVKDYDINCLSKYWFDDTVDITFMKEEDSKEAYNPKPNSWLIIFRTDN